MLNEIKSSSICVKFSCVTPQKCQHLRRTLNTLHFCRLFSTIYFAEFFSAQQNKHRFFSAGSCTGHICSATFMIVASQPSFTYDYRPTWSSPQHDIRSIVRLAEWLVFGTNIFKKMLSISYDCERNFCQQWASQFDHPLSINAFFLSNFKEW